MQPKGELLDAIKRTFETVDHFKEKFTSSAMNNFGSGWTWLIREGDRLAIVNTSNADMPQRSGKKPVLTCDVWEHAYYIDYHNNRSAYLDAFWKLINWDFVEKQLNA